MTSVTGFSTSLLPNPCYLYYAHRKPVIKSIPLYFCILQTQEAIKLGISELILPCETSVIFSRQHYTSHLDLELTRLAIHFNTNMFFHWLRNISPFFVFLLLRLCIPWYITETGAGVLSVYIHICGYIYGDDAKETMILLPLAGLD